MSCVLYQQFHLQMNIAAQRLELPAELVFHTENVSNFLQPFDKSDGTSY
jgi:hypothetical protein